MSLFKRKPDWVITSNIVGNEMVLALGKKYSSFLWMASYATVAKRSTALGSRYFEGWLRWAKVDLEAERDLRILREHQAKELLG